MLAQIQAHHQHTHQKPAAPAAPAKPAAKPAAPGPHTAAASDSPAKKYLAKKHICPAKPEMPAKKVVKQPLPREKIVEIKKKEKKEEEKVKQKNKEKPTVKGEDGKKVPLDVNKFKTIFDRLNKETIDAVKTLKALGGIDGKDFEEKKEPRKCCCWGTPIGDRLLMLAEDLDKDGNTLLAQVQSHNENEADADADSDADEPLMNLALELANNNKKVEKGEVKKIDPDKEDDKKSSMA